MWFYGFMEKPGIEPATPGLQGIALIHYTTGASQYNVHSREKTQKDSKGKQPLLHVTHSLDLIYMPNKYYKIISKVMQVIERTQKASKGE